MARAKKKIEYSTFVKGLNTDAGPLTYPEDSSLVDTNFVLNVDGSRQRRKGVTYENGYTIKSISSLEGDDKPFSNYVWKSVNSTGSLDISVVQVGNELTFYDNNASSISSRQLNGGLSYTLSGVITGKLSFTEAYGKLVVAGFSQNSIALSYNETTDTISATDIFLKIRDVFGLEEISVSRPDERPVNLDVIHEYNLRNQGWPAKTMCLINENGDDHAWVDPITNTFQYIGGRTGTSVYPSNSDTIGMGREDSTIKSWTVGDYSAWKLAKEHGGSVEAPKGHFIIVPFIRGASRLIESGVRIASLDRTDGYLSKVASYAGRLFYSVKKTGDLNLDANSPELGTMIFFSQSSDNTEDFGKCYAKNDPTSEHFFDVLDTDGGFINIPDAGEIYGLTTLGQSLFVIASKGVWEINGGDSYFSATNQNVNKISEFGAISGSSIVSGETSTSFWAEGGIYIIGIDPVSLRGEVTNITDNVVQTLYSDIDPIAKRDAIGIYDDVSKQLRWLYDDGTLASKYYYNRELIFDTNLKAFYINEIGEVDVSTGSSPYITGYIGLPQYSSPLQFQNVILNSPSTNVVQGIDNVISSSVSTVDSTKSAIKYWSVRDLGTGFADLTVSGFFDFDFKDWSYVQDSLGAFGVDAPAELITGYNTDGDAEVDKKAKYITTYLKRTETGFEDLGGGEVGLVGQSSCKLQGQWDWTNSAAAGRWSSEAEVYRLPRFYSPESALDPFDYSFTVVKTKNKMRGKGSSLSLRFTSSPGKDLHLYGWSRELTVPSD